MKFVIPTHPLLKRPVHIALILWKDIQRCDLFKHASAMAYALVLSIIPTLAAVFSLISLFKPLLGKDGSVFMDLEGFVIKHLATGSGEQAVQYIEKFLANLDIAKIGLTGFAGLIISLALFLQQIEEALNRIWHVPEGRSPITRFIYFWTFLTLGAFLIALGVGVVSGFNVSNLVPSFGDQAVKQGSSFLRQLMPFVSSFVFAFLLYKVVPNCRVPAKDAAVGALVTTILVQCATSSYSFYITKFTKYQAVYGALAAVPMFLFWLYLNALIILFGSLLSWRMEQGFTSDGDLVTDGKRIKARDKLRNAHLQTLMPTIVLLAIYQKFRAGDGKGFTGRELAEQMYLPANWIHDALDVLIENHYVHAVQSTTAEDSENFLNHMFVPAVPDEDVKLAALFDSLNSEYKHWIKNWSPEGDTDVRALLNKILNMEAASLKTKTLAHILAS